MEETIFSFWIEQTWWDRLDTITNSLRIEKDGDEYTAFANHHLNRDEEVSFPVSKEQMERLEATLCEYEVFNWYSEYNQMWTLAGTEWLLFDGRLKHKGRNCFPQGFTELLSFISHEFDMDDFGPEEGIEESALNEGEQLAILAKHWLNPAMNKDLPQCEWAEDERDWTTQEGQQNFIHDLNMFANSYPQYNDYAKILQKHEVELDPSILRTCDISNASEKLLVALMIAVLHLDEQNNPSNLFGEFVENGTFAKWLKRLFDFVGWLSDNSEDNGSTCD